MVRACLGLRLVRYACFLKTLVWLYFLLNASPCIVASVIVPFKGA